MIIQKPRVKDLEPNEGQIQGLPVNPRQWTKDDIEKISKSLQETPELFEMRPCIVYPLQDKYIILGGNLRFQGAKKNKEKEIPCIVIDKETSLDKLKEIVIKDNGSFGSWDFDALANEWDDLPLTDWGVPAWNSEDAQEDATDAPQEAKEDDFDESTDKVETRSQRGSIYKLEDHRLMCGDSTDEKDIKTLLQDVKIDFVLSDPPYGMHLDADFSSIKGSLKSIGRKQNTSGNKYSNVIGDHDDFKDELITTFFKNINCDEMFLFGADYFAELLPKKNDGSWLVWDKRKESQADAIGSEFELIWSKQKHKRRMLRHDWFGFLSSQNQADARNRVHPTQKPITLLVDIMSQWGKDARVVLDLYGDSGSTMMACEQMSKSCYMMELDPHYCDVILARWEKMTGKKAEQIK